MGCSYSYVSVGFGQIWRLLSIKERELDDFHVVSLIIMSSANVRVLLCYVSLPNIYTEIIYLIICSQMVFFM